MRRERYDVVGGTWTCYGNYASWVEFITKYECIWHILYIHDTFHFTEKKDLNCILVVNPSTVKISKENTLHQKFFGCPCPIPALQSAFKVEIIILAVSMAQLELSTEAAFQKALTFLLKYKTAWTINCF